MQSQQQNIKRRKKNRKTKRKNATAPQQSGAEFHTNRQPFIDQAIVEEEDIESQIYFEEQQLNNILHHSSKIQPPPSDEKFTNVKLEEDKSEGSGGHKDHDVDEGDEVLNQRRSKYSSKKQR